MTMTDEELLMQKQAQYDLYIKIYVCMAEEGCCSKACDDKAKEAVMHMARYMG